MMLAAEAPPDLGQRGMFLFFFLWAPSGLVIYWTVSNLLGIGQQYATNQIIGRPVVKQVRPPAERKTKNAGSGATDSARDKATQTPCIR